MRKMAYGRPDEQPLEGENRVPDLGNCTRCCCCMTITVLVVIVAAIAIALFVILFVKPTKPRFDLQSVSVQDFSVDRQMQGSLNFQIYLSLDIIFVFSAGNPNRVGIEYSSTSFKCIYDNALLGVARVPSFYQPAHSQTTVKAVITVDRLSLLQSSSVNLFKDATENDNVPLNITGPVRAGIRIFGIHSPKVQVSINCLLVISPRQRGLKRKECNVDQVNI